ncbi:MAG: hypothetical protein ABI432_00335 [Flavobacteriales bacterium]
MLRSVFLGLMVSLISAPAIGQSFGLLAGIRHGDMRAAGLNFAPSNGLALGAFIPFYMTNRIVLRAECGVLVDGYDQVKEEKEYSSATMVSASAGLVGRFYMSRSFSISTGLELRLGLSEPFVVQSPGGEGIPERTDYTLMFGSAYRFNKRFELGLRYGQGLRPAMDTGIYGPAKRRSFTVMASYLLKNKPKPLAKRRRCRIPLATAPNY